MDFSRQCNDILCDFQMIEFIFIFCIAAAVIALETRNLLSSIISLGGLGFGLAIIMLFIGAPDVAIVQILVEVILLIILIRATISRDVTEVICKKEFFGIVFGISMVFAIFIVIFSGLNELPEFGTNFSELSLLPGQEIPAQQYLLNSLEETSSRNVVNAIILNYRGLDMMGEAAVLFAAIMGAVAVLRKRKEK